MGQLKYTLGFAYCKETDEILMLNREKKPWMGRWNGVGGKLDIGESPIDCIIRETMEEAGLDLPGYTARGVLLWNENNLDVSIETVGEGGLYLFTADVTKDFRNSYKTPVQSTCEEGILDWKKLSWVLSPDNLGITSNLKYLLPTILSSNEFDLFKSEHVNHEVVQFEHKIGGNVNYPFK